MKAVFRTGIAIAAMVSMNAMVLAQDMPTKVGPGEGALNIVAWAGYIERGDNDPKIDWVTGFEKATGCKVAVKVAATSDEMVTLINGGGFDLVTASGDASLRLIAGKKVVPINTDLVPNWANVDDRLKSGAWYTVDGKHYGIPYQWGPNVLLYNTDVFKTAPTSWNVVFEEQTLPDGKSNKGRVQAYAGPIYIADAAVYLKAKDPSLGITDPYELTEPQYQAAIDLLKKQRELVGRYWLDYSVQVDDFKTEGVVASSSWPLMTNTLLGANAHVAQTIPDEGATGWSDTSMLTADAQHPNCAYMWLNHSLEPKVQGDVAYWFGSLPVVPAACKGNELLTDTGCTANGWDYYDKLAFWKTPIAQCKDGNDQCVPYSRWVSDYLGVMGSGQ